MNKKVIIFEVIIILIAFIYYFVFIMIPEYKKSIGSSDHLFKYDKYTDMYEFLYDDGCNFSIILDNENVVYHILFFDKKSISLYNKRIEGMSLESVLDIIVDTFGKENLKIYYYNDLYLNTIKKVFDNSVYTSISIKDKCSSLGININSDEVMLQDMDYYSKEIIRDYKNNKDNLVETDDFKNYSDSVYRKIEDYVSSNNITDLDKNNTLLVINMIPADKDLMFYPSVDSWYYVKDGRVFSYIQFTDENKVYEYCYQGSIDLRSEGKCR